MNEQQAIVALKQRRIEGLAVLVEAYQQQALRAAQLITRDYGLAEDVVQSAFIKVYECISQFDERRPFNPWFFRIVINAAIKMVSRQRTVSLDEITVDGADVLQQLLQTSALGPEQLFEHGETREAVSEALDRLSPQQRAVIVQRYYLDLSMDDIAANLSCPPGTVKSRLHTARAQLRRLLQPFSSPNA